MVYYNHLSIGNVSIRHKDKDIVTSLNSDSFELFLQQMESFDYDIGYIPPGYEHRADLISDLFYETPKLDWLICWFNNVADPFQGLNVFDRILIPKLV
jgi:hypothetical protein